MTVSSVPEMSAAIAVPPAESVGAEGVPDGSFASLLARVAGMQAPAATAAPTQAVPDDTRPADDDARVADDAAKPTAANGIDVLQAWVLAAGMAPPLAVPPRISSASGAPDDASPGDGAPRATGAEVGGSPAPRLSALRVAPEPDVRTARSAPAEDPSPIVADPRDAQAPSSQAVAAPAAEAAGRPPTALDGAVAQPPLPSATSAPGVSVAEASPPTVLTAAAGAAAPPTPIAAASAQASPRAASSDTAQRSWAPHRARTIAKIGTDESDAREVDPTARAVTPATAAPAGAERAPDPKDERDPAREGAAPPEPLLRGTQVAARPETEEAPTPSAPLPHAPPISQAVGPNTSHAAVATVAAAAASVDGASAPSAARAPAAPVPLHGLADQIEWQVSQGGGSARVRLDPPHLGQLDLSVTVRGERVEIVFTPHDAAQPELVHGQREAIGAALARLDLRVEHFEVRPPPPDAQASFDASGRDARPSTGDPSASFGEAPGDRGGRREPPGSYGAGGAPGWAELRPRAPRGAIDLRV